MPRISRQNTNKKPSKNSRLVGALTLVLLGYIGYNQFSVAPATVVSTKLLETKTPSERAKNSGLPNELKADLQVQVRRREQEQEQEQPQKQSITKSAPAPAPLSQPKQTKPQQKYYYDESKILTFTDTLVKAPQTVVTAYFQVKSKHSSDSYSKWMKNMLSLQDPMVIFLSPALIPTIRQLRQHALDRTVIIPMEIDQVPLANLYNESFWQWQLDIDKEKRIHRSYFVFWIWLSKSWWVTQAIRHNFFDSQVYVWSDMGCFRDKGYNGKTMVQHFETIPRDRMLFLAHQRGGIVPPPSRIWNNKYTQGQHFYHSGSMFTGYANVWVQFEQYFMETLQEFLDRDMFIGEDQTVLQSTCLSHPDICAYVPAKEVRDNNYFGLRYVLHFGGNYTHWHPPPLK